MTKKELVKVISDAMKISQAEATRRIADINVMVETIAKALEVEDKAKLGDYIVVEKKLVPARIARNPKTGEEIQVAEKVAIKVKATAAAKKL